MEQTEKRIQIHLTASYQQQSSLTSERSVWWLPWLGAIFNGTTFELPLALQLLRKKNFKHFIFQVLYHHWGGSKLLAFMSFIVIIVKKLDSLKRFVRTTVAASHN